MECIRCGRFGTERAHRSGLPPVVLLQSFGVDPAPLRGGSARTCQAATWNSVAMNSAWALMSLPLMFRTCPFLIIAIAS